MCLPATYRSGTVLSASKQRSVDASAKSVVDSIKGKYSAKEYFRPFYYTHHGKALLAAFGKNHLRQSKLFNDFGRCGRPYQQPSTYKGSEKAELVGFAKKHLCQRELFNDLENAEQVRYLPLTH